MAGTAGLSASCLVAAVAVAAGPAVLTAAASGQQAGQPPPPCQAVAAGAPPSQPQPTSIATVEQAYYCIFSHYFSGATLDDSVLLTGAFEGFTLELRRRGLDQAAAMLPALSGDRDSDWMAFSNVYQRVISDLPDDPQLRQALVTATMNGMLASLHDDHAEWFAGGAQKGQGSPALSYGLGMTTSTRGVGLAQPDAAPPLFITSVVPGSPASRNGLRPGDIIAAVNGIPPFADGQLNPGVLAWIEPAATAHDTVRLTVQRPSTARTWAVGIVPGSFTPQPPISATVLAGDIAYVRLTGFLPNAASQVITAISNLGLSARLRGIILDLRGNGGGSPTEVARLLGAFVHGKIWSYDVDLNGTRTANYTDDSVPLLNQPLVVLTDRYCASACDAFSDAVRDLHIGQLVGTRTAGLIAGLANGYLLDDNSALGLPSTHSLGADGEIVDGIGVAPDDSAPLTARALSTGHDPAIAKALSLLRSGARP